MKRVEKAEGQRVKEIFNSDRSCAQRLLAECKRREKSKALIPVRLERCLYLVPEGTDMEKWKKEKARNLEKFRHNDISIL
jgi:hypothetical protein